MAGGRRRKRVNKSKTRQSVIAHAEDDLSQVTEELTALSAIFQEDFTLISEDPFKEISIVVQPHSGAIGSHENVSAELYVRCFPGYPNKPPKLQVRSKEGLSEEGARSLHSMLVNQASSISREGRVMVFNLVEAAQEFLSEYIRSDLSQDLQEDQCVTTRGIDSWGAVSNSEPYTTQQLEVPSVYGVVDLFTELDEDYYWKIEPKQIRNIESQKIIGSSIANLGRQEPLGVGYFHAEEQKSVHGEDNTLALQGKRQSLDQYLVSESKAKDLKPQVGKHAAEQLPMVDEKEGAGICEPNTFQFSSVTELLQNLYTGIYPTCCKNPISVEQNVMLPLLGSIDQEPKTIPPVESTLLSCKDGPGMSVRRDFLLVYLLRLVCCRRGPLPRALPALALQLQKLDGDFDIVGDTFGLAEAESIKVVVDIIRRSGITDLFEICINHANILDAIWSWSGVKSHQRQDVAKVLSSGGCASPLSPDRKSRWVHIRRQLMQGLQLPEDVVDCLQTVERRWSGPPEEALSRLRGGLVDMQNFTCRNDFSGDPISSAMDELSTLQSYLRVWGIGKYVHVDALMVPAEECYKGLYFQVYIPKGCCQATSSAGMLLAVGGRYDHLVKQFWTKSLGLPSPGAVGISIALEKLILAASESSEPETGAEVLVCSKGGGGMLRERMEVVSELWDGNIKAQFVHSISPSLTEQYEHAREHGIKWLVIITEAGLDHANSVKVRHMELRLEEDISRANLVRYFSDAPVTAIKRQAALLREGN